MPDLVGMTTGEAVSACASMGIDYTIQSVENSYVEPGIVLGQSVLADSVIDDDTAVVIMVSGQKQTITETTTAAETVTTSAPQTTTTPATTAPVTTTTTSITTTIQTSAVNTTSYFFDEPLMAVLGYTDVNWKYQDWDSYVEIFGNGTYTITSTAVAGSEEIHVFEVDIQDMYRYYPDATVTLDSIYIDGTEISFDATKIIYGDVENKGNYRIEIYSFYGNSSNSPSINIYTPINESLSVTFTISGLMSE